MNTVITIVVAVLGALNLTQLIIFFINRYDSRKNVEGKLTTLEKDVLRTQLLLLILMRPESKAEIMTVAQQYFGVLHADWYMTDIFNHWLTEQGDSAPEWFDREG